MSEPTHNEALRDALEDMCYQFAYDGTRDGGPTLTTGGLSALEGAFRLLGWEDPHPIPHARCDEPGCPQRAACGWPDKNNRYRRTCTEHYLIAPDGKGIR